MTLRELNHYFELREQLTKAEEMLASFRAVASPGAQVLTGMPVTHDVRDKVGDLAAEIVDLETSISYLEKEYDKARKTIIVFVESITDDYIRSIIRLRFLYALTWKEVAIVTGGGNTENSVKSAFHRYMRVHEKLQRPDTP